jgi:hypothetical protein
VDCICGNGASALRTTWALLSTCPFITNWTEVPLISQTNCCPGTKGRICTPAESRRRVTSSGCLVPCAMTALLKSIRRLCLSSTITVIVSLRPVNT